MSRKTVARPSEPEGNRRGSPEAIAKRRAARQFNKVLLGEEAITGADGRTERRRRRLLDELANGIARSGKRALKPVEVLARVQELLVLGEPVASIRNACPPPRAIVGTPDVVEGVRRLHVAYGFPAEAYSFVGLDAATLRAAGVRGVTGPRRTGPGLHSTQARRRLTPPAARG